MGVLFTCTTCPLSVAPTASVAAMSVTARHPTGSSRVAASKNANEPYNTVAYETSIPEA